MQGSFRRHLRSISKSGFGYHMNLALMLTTNHEINPAELCNCLFYRSFELRWLTNVCLGCNATFSSRLGELFCRLRNPFRTTTIEKEDRLCRTEKGSFELLGRNLLSTNNYRVCAMSHLYTVSSASFKSAYGTKKINLAHTIDSVMPRQMPEPPPVQKSTFPLKISVLKIAFEFTA